MSTKQGPAHIVVDGSNIATEGRSLPSLKQLSEAVASFMEEHPSTAVTVVVDATFGHRIDKKEVQEFEAGIANNELVAPPAGAVGRGDAFVLSIADKAGASVLSNDSFQEFHGEYTWLFDDGRLIGGKPVPHVGWVWVNRLPVRGPVSRKATRGGSSSGSGRGSGTRSRRGAARDEFEVRTGSPEASAPMPTPKSPPPGLTTARPKPGGSVPANPSMAKPAPKGGEPVNDLMPFLDFVEHHPIGSSVNGTVDAYSSHGAYITIADTGVRGYIPLRLMADPPPRSAKSVMKIDESVTVVVVSFAASRRSIDCALPDMAALELAEAEAIATPAALETTGAKTATKKAATKKAATKTVATKTVATKTVATTGRAASVAETKTVAKKATTKKAVAATATVTKKATTKKATTKKAVAATKKTATPKQTATKQAATKQAATKQTSTRKAASKKPAAQSTMPTAKSVTKRTAGAGVTKKITTRDATSTGDG